MADKVKLSKDGNSIDFVQSENMPTSVKKFRQSPEIEGFYRFVFENDLQKEAFEILDRISAGRKAKKLKEKQDAQPAKSAAAAKVKEAKKVEAAAVAAATVKAQVKAAPPKAAAKPVFKPAAKAVPAKASAKKLTKKK